MKRNIFNLFAFFLISGMFMTSCVSSKKFQASEARAEKLQKDFVGSQSQLNTTLGQLNECNSNVKALKVDGASMKSEYEMVVTDMQELSKESKMTIAEQASRLKRLQDRINEQNQVMLKLKSSIADALVKYSADELYVYIKDGNVYVSMEEKLLFKSGSAVIDPKGKEALKSLSQVINNTPDITVMIEGHTDNVPIKTIVFRDNWDLSTARATSIVRILTTDFGFDPNRITAAGKSQFHPVKTNETTEGRAGNRRTEVILSPDLKELYDLLYQ